MDFIPQWAPNIHPMLVHFPIAILGIAIFFDFVSFFLPDKQKWWNEETTAYLYGVGAAIAIVVYFTGEAAADSVTLPAKAQTILSEHADWATWAVWFYGLYAAARIWGTWKAAPRHRLKFHVGFFVLSLAGLFLLFQTGDHGAQMVFQYGVGVKAAKIENPVRHDHDTDHASEGNAHKEDFTSTENGDWLWNISEESVKTFQKRFTFLKGTFQSLQPEIIKNAQGTELQLQASNAFFVNNESYGDIQFDLTLDPADFNGTLWVVHHVRDALNYDYWSINSQGVSKLGRVEEGQNKVIEQDRISLSKADTLRLVRAGDHLRSYINGDLILHGHAEAAPAGAVGLKIEGRGTIGLEKMELVRIEPTEHGEEAHEEDEHSH